LGLKLLFNGYASSKYIIQSAVVKTHTNNSEVRKVNVMMVVSHDPIKCRLRKKCMLSLHEGNLVCNGLCRKTLAKQFV
jgi:hypothetical protein